MAVAGLLALFGVTWLAASALSGCGNSSEGEKRAAVATPTHTPPPELPGRGCRRLLPDYRMVGFYGAPQDDELGELGIGTPDSAARRLKKQIEPYERGKKPIMPVLELIAVTAQAAPGTDGMYRARQTDQVIRRYLRAARRHDGLLLLDIQPGRADFFTETLKLRKWLKEPDVGLALDPEWRVTAGQVPGQVIGTVTSREVNATSAWLDMLSEKHDLPQKLFVIHQFTEDMIDEKTLKLRDRLAMVLNVDGFGGQTIKKAKYDGFAQSTPRGFHLGYKLFYREDIDLMSPRQVMKMRPRPDLIVYE